MKVENYISDLLYRYECVIVPNFGGFVTNETSAKLNHFTHTFYPPSKQISFNSQLKNNDGLLANHIASVEKIPFSDAVLTIKKATETWNLSLQKGTVEISKIGSLSLNNDGKIIFEPTVLENYLTSSFGLSSFSSPAVKRITYKQKSRKLAHSEIIFPSNEVVVRKKVPAFLKYAATAAIIFTLGSIGWNEYNQNQFQQQLLAEQQQQEALNEKIQQATFVINNPLPAITLNVTKEIKNYHVIAGAFREPQNAEKKVQQLIKNGFDAEILGVNKWNLTQVSYGSYGNRQEALNSLKTIKNTVASDAWLLVKAF